VNESLASSHRQAHSGADPVEIAADPVVLQIRAGGRRDHQAAEQIPGRSQRLIAAQAKAAEVRIAVIPGDPLGLAAAQVGAGGGWE
jgi:hypothetical protein